MQLLQKSMNLTIRDGGDQLRSSPIASTLQSKKFVSKKLATTGSSLTNKLNLGNEYSDRRFDESYLDTEKESNIFGSSIKITSPSPNVNKPVE